MNFAKGQSVWLTKWVLTHGIIATQIEDPQYCDPRPGITPQVGVLALPGLPKYDDVTHGVPWFTQRIHYFFKPDWHIDRGEAILQAQKMLQRKRRALQKAMDALNQADTRLLDSVLDPNKDIRV